MAAFDTTRTTYAAPGFTTSVASRLATMFGAFVQWNDARMTRNALNNLTDRELSDIGLVRGDIEEVCERQYR